MQQQEKKLCVKVDETTKYRGTKCAPFSHVNI